MRQPDCFIVNGAIVIIMWLMQRGTLFSGDSSEAFVQKTCGDIVVG